MFIVPKTRVLVSQDKANDSVTSDDTSQLHSDGEPLDESNVTISSVNATGLIDPTVQYQFRTENGGAVTYRVVQVTQDGEVSEAGGGQVVTTAALVAPQVAQAIITSPFAASNGSESPDVECTDDEGKFSYFPGSSGTESGITNSPETASLAASATGQFYVMMSPQDVLQTTGQRPLAPRTHFTPRVEGHKTARDERRRATHNEVERRRRDKINNWIIKLSKIVPDCTADQTKQGQVSSTSKGGILAKACDYIQELRSANVKAGEIVKENERLQVEMELLRQQSEEIKNINQMLRVHLQQNGIAVADDLGDGTS